MAGGDWIKMRAGLLDNPKVIAIARSLMRDPEFREWLAPGGGSSSGPIVSDAALRGVTVAALLKVWSVSRETGMFVDADLVLPHSELPDLDQISGVPGLGKAMNEVGWALSENGVTLPNFKEFNVPLTGAERQARLRQKRVTESNGEPVTSPLPEQRREEKKLDPCTSKAGKARPRQKAKSPAASRKPFQPHWPEPHYCDLYQQFLELWTQYKPGAQPQLSRKGLQQFIKLVDMEQGVGENRSIAVEILSKRAGELQTINLLFKIIAEDGHKYTGGSA